MIRTKMWSTDRRTSAKQYTPTSSKGGGGGAEGEDIKKKKKKKNCNIQMIYKKNIPCCH